MRPSTPPDNPFASLWAELATARWVADVGLPLSAALVAIGLSAYFVQHQTRHAQELARAQRRATAAGALGTALLAELDKLDHIPGDSPFWVEGKWPDFGAIVEAQRRASDSLGDDGRLEDAIYAARTPMWIWATCQSEWPSLEAEGVSLTNFSIALDSTLHPWKLDWSNYATSLIQWDGLGELPHLSIGKKLHVPLPVAQGRSQHDAWARGYRARFQDAATRARDISQAHSTGE